MLEGKIIVTPGPVFYDVFLGYLRAMGVELRDWATERGVTATNARSAACGSWNGPKAKALRGQMVESVGEETFQRLYAERLRRDAA